jgi:hypothetical protein
MITKKYNITYIFTMLLATIILVLPASAVTVAMYGTGSGFNPDLHKDTVVVAASISGSSGSDLDSHVDQFTDPSVDVIILGGEDSFSLSTAAKIEAAVAGGKILLISYPCNKKFSASLPAANGGTTGGGQFLELADPTRVMSKEIFSGLPLRYPLEVSEQEHEQVVVNKGALTLLKYDTGTPTLLYIKYGKGYVIEWTTVPAPAYMKADVADIINYRLISNLIPVTSIIPVTTTMTETATPTSQPVNATVTPVPTESPMIQPVTGNVSVHSSPPGASILIDMVYKGITPAIVENIAPGKHSIRLTLSGYHDYDAPVYVTAGETEDAFGTLQPLGLNTGTPVATPIIVTVPVTAEPAQPDAGLDNNILVAVIGVVTAVIGAVATLFSRKKE